jgi:hypothetical protein
MKSNKAKDAMPHPLQARWDLTRQHLAAAADFIRRQSDTPEVQRCVAEYAEFLDHNELECALDMLECACESFDASPNTFELLAVAAESMELRDRALALRRLSASFTSTHISNDPVA